MLAGPSPTRHWKSGLATSKSSLQNLKEDNKKMSMFKDIPVDVGVIYEGERIRRNDMQVELGGPSLKEKFELAKVKPLEEVEDGKITWKGPTIKDMKEGEVYPLGILVEAAGATLEQGL